MKWISLFFFAAAVSAQAPLSLQECEARFLKENLYLLANHYQIDAANAEVLQAKIWDNPEFGFEVNALSPNERQKFFNAGKYGEKTAFVQQLVHIGGQRKNQVRYAQSNAALAELDFSVLLRDLRFQLRSAFFAVYFDRNSVAQIDEQLTSLKTLVDHYGAQEKKGNVSLKDVVRLQNLYIGLKSDRAELTADLLENQKKLSLLVSPDGSDFTPAPTASELEAYRKPMPSNVAELQQMALANRPDVKRAEKAIEAGDWNLKWQRSLAVPDLTLGASYDQMGGAFDNQTNLTVGIPLPLWNKNKGNIKVAKAQLQQLDAEKDIKKREVAAEVKAAYLNYWENRSNFDLVNSNIPADLQTVFKGIYDNFLKRNIGMLEFTDFLESYNQSVIAFNRISKSYINACEEMNYATASPLF